MADPSAPQEAARWPSVPNDYPRPLMNNPPPNKDYNREPDFEALKWRAILNQGSTLRGS